MRADLVAIVFVAGCRMGFDSHDASIAGDDTPTGDGAVDGRAPSDGTAGCPGNYAALAGAPTTSRYRTVDTSTEWEDGERDCEGDGHHLAIADDAAELAALHAALPAENLWVGVTDRRTQGVWLAVTGVAAAYLPWAPAQPDSDDCVYIDSALGMYVAQDCDSGRRYLCECDGAVAMPSSY